MMRRNWAFPLALVLQGCGLLADGQQANELFREGRYAEALTTFEALHSRHPDAADIGYNLGTTLIRVGRYEDAVAKLDHALGLATPATQALAEYNRGEALFRLGRLLEAREAFKAVLRLEPANRDAKFNLEIVDRVLAQLPQGGPDECHECQRSPGGDRVPAVPRDPSGAGDLTLGTNRQLPPGARELQQEPDQRPLDSSTASDQGPPAAARPDDRVDFRSDYRAGISMDEAARLLDSLRAQQTGFQGLIYGSPEGFRP
jgi:tetratricopeptide (TPR) repeat protein